MGTIARLKLRPELKTLNHPSDDMYVPLTIPGPLIQKWLPGTPNQTEPSSLLLVTPVLFLSFKKNLSAKVSKMETQLFHSSNNETFHKLAKHLGTCVCWLLLPASLCPPPGCPSYWSWCSCAFSCISPLWEIRWASRVDPCTCRFCCPPSSTHAPEMCQNTWYRLLYLQRAFFGDRRWGSPFQLFKRATSEDWLTRMCFSFIIPLESKWLAESLSDLLSNSSLLTKSF